MEIIDRDFFKEPFNRSEIEGLLQGRPASEMFNSRSPSYKKLELNLKKPGDKEMIDWMTKEPRLIRRPVVQIGKKVYFGATDLVLAGIFKA